MVPKYFFIFDGFFRIKSETNCVKNKELTLHVKLNSNTSIKHIYEVVKKINNEIGKLLKYLSYSSF